MECSKSKLGVAQCQRHSVLLGLASAHRSCFRSKGLASAQKGSYFRSETQQHTPSTTPTTLFAVSLSLFLLSLSLSLILSYTHSLSLTQLSRLECARTQPVSLLLLRRRRSKGRHGHSR